MSGTVEVAITVTMFGDAARAAIARGA